MLAHDMKLEIKLNHVLLLSLVLLITGINENKTHLHLRKGYPTDHR
jgi:hypothetical protein